MKPLIEKFESVRFSASLPLPPSINAYYRSYTGNGRHCVVLSSEARAYHRAIAAAVTGSKKMLGPVFLAAWIHPRNRRVIDLDNRIKPLLDALTRVGLWEDDSQIWQIQLFRMNPVPGGRCCVYADNIPEAHPIVNFDALGRDLGFDEPNVQ